MNYRYSVEGLAAPDSEGRTIVLGDRFTICSAAISQAKSLLKQ